LSGERGTPGLRGGRPISESSVEGSYRGIGFRRGVTDEISMTLKEENGPPLCEGCSATEEQRRGMILSHKIERDQGQNE